MSIELMQALIELGNVDAVKEYVKTHSEHGESLALLVDFGLTSAGVIQSILQGVRGKKDSIVIKQEILKMQLALQAIEAKMRKHGIVQLPHFTEANLNPNRYQFARNIFQEAVDAKSERLREYCASTIVYAGIIDYAENYDYRKLYRTLDIIRQLDDLDIELIKLYDLEVQKRQEPQKSEKLEKQIHNLEHQLVDDDSITQQDLFLSSEKLRRLGILDYGINNTKSPDQALKLSYLVDLKVLNNPNYPTPVYLDFNAQVHTFM